MVVYKVKKKKLRDFDAVLNYLDRLHKRCTKLTMYRWREKPDRLRSSHNCWPPVVVVVGVH